MANNFKLEFEDGTTDTVSVNIKPAKDIIQFVAGTIDPTNIKGFEHEANKEYWRGTDNFWQGINELKSQFLDLHIEDEFFSWSGDNNAEERTKAAERLFDVLLRVYRNWTEKEVHLHLIAHSHGGNVINQFTEIIAQDDRFPPYWKIKSITYLSTPFFKEQHQLNHQKLHPDCKIINVYNEYDITQRFIADFSLNNLEVLVQKAQRQNFAEAIEAINKTNFESFEILKDFVINNHEEGPELWREAVVFLDGFDQLMDAMLEYVNSLNPKKLQSQLEKLKTLLKNIKAWGQEARKTLDNNKQGRKGGYGKGEFIEDADLAMGIKLINKLVATEEALSSSYLINILASIFEEGTDITNQIDDTSWTPEKQIQSKYEITHLNITQEDPYDRHNKKSDFEDFATGIENSMKEGKLNEVLMNLLSQLIDPDFVKDIIAIISILVNLPIFEKSFDDELAIFNLNLFYYHRKLRKYHKALVVEEGESLFTGEGSLAYFAMESHGLSHSKLWDEVEQVLRGAFSSGEDPRYQDSV